ncbi:D-alanyl-D-alanine carboxypeptidase [Patescibacteria group bacterium]|nr:MAG: D-alanyl-D-alanine carboxypeptidase [Patescibacteria group bacterium]
MTLRASSPCTPSRSSSSATSACTPRRSCRNTATSTATSASARCSRSSTPCRPNSLDPMIIRLAAQLILATTLFQMFPIDAGVVERAATLPVSAPREGAGVRDALSLMARPILPEAGDRKPVKVEAESLGVVTTAVSAMVVDRATGEVLFEKNAEEPRSIGSITKLMTAYVFLEGRPDLSAPAEIQSSDVRAGGVQHLSGGDQVTVRDLLRASLVGSDNTATAALVRLSGLPGGDFVARMNETAAEMGMRKTTFVDETGLSSDNRSIAPDLVRMIDRTMQVEEIRAATELSAVDIRGASGRTYRVESTNDLLGTFMNRPPYRIVGGKTGFLPEAGYCFGSIVSEGGGHEVIVVVLGSDSKDGRFQDAKALAAWAFKVYKWPDEQKS